MKEVKIPEHVRTDPEALDPFTKRNWDHVDRSVRGWASGFMKLEKYVNRRIDEQPFRVLFLPLMLGKLNGQDFRDAYYAWLKVAGNEWGEVDVVNVRGEVVATVPAFNDLSRFSPLTAGQMALPEKIDHALRLGTINPNIGRAKFADTMNTALATMHDPEAYATCQAKWTKFFAYFGHHFDGPKGVAAEPEKLQNTPTTRGGPQDTDIEVDW